MIDNFMKKRPEGVSKSQNTCFTFGHNSGWNKNNVLSSKLLHTVTKNGISPQRKHGSSWNFELQR